MLEMECLEVLRLKLGILAVNIMLMKMLSFLA